MKRLACVLCVLLAAFSTSCGSAASKTVNPGDKIGNVQILSGDGQDVSFAWSLKKNCTQQEGTENYTCKVGLNTKVNVSWGVYASRGKDLDTVWAGHTYKMYINDRPVNLEAFGSVDEMHPIVGKMRHWNVVVVASKPGTVVVKTEAIVDGNPAQDTITYMFE